jgi:hypothetical protein
MVQSSRPSFRAVKTACTLLETAPAGEDGGDELCVGMASSAKVGDNGIDVETHAAVGDGQSVAVVLQEKPAGRAAGTGQSCAAGVESTDAVNETIRGEMGAAM